MRRIGVLMGGDENDPERKIRLSALTQALAGLSWTDFPALDSDPNLPLAPSLRGF
jgi:hypothetical protein